MDTSSFPIDVTSEIGKLRTVLLHRPGKEIENLVPDMLERLLFDDIPYLEIAQQEHDVFAQILRDNGVEVLYLDDLVAESVKDDAVRDNFINEFLDEGKVYGEGIRAAIKEYFSSLSSEELVRKMMSGMRKNELPKIRAITLSDLVYDNYPFILDPMPNLYFTRDPFATIGTGITLNRMSTETRNRETLFAKYIFKYHPKFKDAYIPIWFDRNEKTSLEGGDILILNKKVLAVGITERTDPVSVEILAKKLFNGGQTFETVLAFNIPKKRAFMHLDTVFTMVDYDKFTIHPGIEGPLQVFSITKSEMGNLKIKEEHSTIEDILKKFLGLNKVTLIRCAGGDLIDSSREQWNDGSNTLAIAPGEVIVYSRNHVTNKILQEYGVKIHVMPSSELSRGRGGPRCMSMPLVRESI